MNKKLLYAAIVVLLAIIAGGGTYFFLNKAGTKTEAPPTGGSNLTANQSLSEQPDRAKFNEYFSDLYLAEVPTGKPVEGQPPVINKKTVFNFGESICIGGGVKKTVPASSYAEAVYDVASKTFTIQKRASDRPLAIGGFLGCEDLFVGQNQSLPRKTYEFKIYLDGILAAVLPFEVK